MRIGRFIKLLLPGAGLFAMALFTGEQIFILASFMPLGMLLFAFLSALLAFALVRVECRAPQGHIEKGEWWRLEILIALYSPLPIGRVGLELRIPYMHAGNVAMEEGFVHPFGKKHLKRKFLCEFRGVYECGVVYARAEDIFGIFHFRRTLAWKPFVVSVSPKYIALSPVESAPHDEGYQALRSQEDTNSYADIRQYEPGDPLRRIHWKLSLKRRELLVRQFEAQTMADMLLLLDVTPPEGIATLRMRIEDLLCDCAASIAHAQLSSNNPVYMPLFSQKRNLLLRGQGNRDFPAFLEALTQLEFDGTADMSEVLAKETRLFQGSHCVLILSHLSAGLTDNILRLMHAAHLRIIAVLQDEHEEFREQIDRLRGAGISLLVVTPAMGVKELAKGDAYA